MASVETMTDIVHTKKPGCVTLDQGNQPLTFSMGTVSEPETSTLDQATDLSTIGVHPGAM